MGKVFLFLIGFFLVFTGLSTIILYINLFVFGYNFKEYISFIVKLPDFYFLIIGIALILISTKRRKQYEKCI